MRCRGNVAGDKRRGADCKITGELIEADGKATRFGPTGSIFMIAVMDQARP